MWQTLYSKADSSPATTVKWCAHNKVLVSVLKSYNIYMYIYKILHYFYLNILSTSTLYFAQEWFLIHDFNLKQSVFIEHLLLKLFKMDHLRLEQMLSRCASSVLFMSHYFLPVCHASLIMMSWTVKMLQELSFCHQRIKFMCWRMK